MSNVKCLLSPSFQLQRRLDLASFVLIFVLMQCPFGFTGQAFYSAVSQSLVAWVFGTNDAVGIRRVRVACASPPTTSSSYVVSLSLYHLYSLVSCFVHRVRCSVRTALMAGVSAVAKRKTAVEIGMPCLQFAYFTPRDMFVRVDMASGHIYDLSIFPIVNPGSYSLAWALTILSPCPQISWPA